MGLPSNSRTSDFASFAMYGNLLAAGKDKAVLLPGVYELINVESGAAVDLSGADHVTLIGYSHHGGENQQWEFSPSAKAAANGLTRFSIRSVRTRLCMALSGSAGAIGWTNFVAQNWQIEVEQIEDCDVVARIIWAPSGQALAWDENGEIKLANKEADNSAQRWQCIRVRDLPHPPRTPPLDSPTPSLFTGPDGNAFKPAVVEDDVLSVTSEKTAAHVDPVDPVLKKAPGAGVDLTGELQESVGPRPDAKKKVVTTTTVGFGSWVILTIIRVVELLDG